MAPALITTQEPLVTLNVGGQPINFLLDSRATSLVAFQPWAPPPPNKSATIRGIPGKPVTRFFIQPLSCDWESIFFSHAFLIVPEPNSSFKKRYFVKG